MGSLNRQIRYMSYFTAKTLLSNENQKKCLELFKEKTTKIVGRVPDSSKSKKYAAVLIPICVDKNGKLSLLYTKRSANLRSHVLQISFPGGIRDDTDNSFEECALRETEEEIGLDRQRINVIGTGGLLRPPHTAAIMPVVGIINNLSLNELNLNRNEVDEVYMIDIEELCSPIAKRHTQFKVGYSAPCFIVQNNRIKIWGITGLITNIFLSCLLRKNVFSPRIDYIMPYKLDISKS